MSYWLVKSEPVTYGINALERDKETLWEGVRNYQARNFLQSMEVGDLVLFYHSNAEPPGVAGVAAVSKTAVADPTQFKKNSDYYDEKATKDKPRWFCPTIKFKQKFAKLISIEMLREQKGLQKMQLLQRGNRLSVMPLTADEYRLVLNLAKKS